MTAAGHFRRQGEESFAAVLAVALDVPDADAALRAVRPLEGLPLWMKVGLELFTAEGPRIVRLIEEMGFPVFLDMKFHDIPTTVERAVKAACHLGVSMLTLHLSGGEAMARAAVRARNGAAQVQGINGPLLMGVTVLTSEHALDADGLADTVVDRARSARAWGLDGVVCSGQEAAAVKAACGRDFLCLCPGIRFADQGSHDDQARVCTPEVAIDAGADFLVMGRPILRAPDPAHAAKRALGARARSPMHRPDAITD